MPAVPYRPVTETMSMTWAMLSMPIGIRPMTPGSAKVSAPGVLRTPAYLRKPVLCESARACWGCVIAAMLSTLGADRTSGKLQFHACGVVRFEPGVVADPRPRCRRAAAVPARAPAQGRDQVRAARCRRAAAVIARAGQGAGPLARSCAGLLRPAAGRGLPERGRRIRDAGCRAGGGGR